MYKRQVLLYERLICHWRAVAEDMLCVKLLIKDHNVGVFAGSQSTVVFDNAYGARRVDGSTFDGACKGDPQMCIRDRSGYID